MRLHPLLFLAAVLLVSACSPPAPSAADLVFVEGRLARIEQSKEFTSLSSLRIWLHGHPQPFTTWLPPAWNEDVAASACASGTVSLRVDRTREIWQVACGGRMLLSYERKVSLIRDRWHMGSTAVLTTGFLAVLVLFLVRPSRRRARS